MPFGPLISAEELSQLSKNSRNLRLLDARPNADAYQSGHLEGALHANLNVHLSRASDPGFNPVRGGRHPLPAPDKWASQLGLWGISPQTQVVVYDDANGSNAASRTWWMLRAAGHTEVAVLDGGIQAAEAAGISVSSTKRPLISTLPLYPPMNIAQKWQLPIVDQEFLEGALEDKGWKILDVRSRERWRGESEPIDPVPGRIPGTLNLPFSENLDSHGRYKKSEDLRKIYSDLLGQVPVKNLIVHCGSGVTACHTLLALEIAGMSGASLYVGSYSEWCRSGKPIGKGA